ncbi:MAG: hypothetical protein AW08_02615 [Candidatus Accumulibacter adjunctus]|uniref:Uncharacterized protein n=1 Tax=Candidatus Accumulibacter adjunctus TaxID=1454001 RepID=A0A011MVB2_9PROT|nr:MAG: hypothetical protein AW08_02615 [Candidatus Accumulibacter adjunctus]
MEFGRSAGARSGLNGEAPATVGGAGRWWYQLTQSHGTGDCWRTELPQFETGGSPGAETRIARVAPDANAR